MNTSFNRSGDPNRRGLALVVVLGMLTLLMAMIFIATDRSTAGAKQINQFQDGSRALGAVTAELSRRERDVMLLASVGDAANFAEWSDYFGHENYGVDFIGDCEVRWRIEPARTAPVADPAGSTSIPYIVNPSPDPTYTAPNGSTEQPNGTLYMYKVSAEARQMAGDRVVSRAQGSRFVAIDREPLFRYVIFYAQRGPKGDLELSHADSVNIQGNIHSNGAIYIGGGLKVNDKIAQRGTFNGSLTASQTRVGPDQLGKPVISSGVDGIFRLSKPLMFSIINGLPLAATTLPAAGAPVGDWTADRSYNTASVLLPTETSVPSGSTPQAMTGGGQVINPYRILTASGAVTQGPDNADNARLFNGTALRGINDLLANDARDDQRSGSRKWATVAAADFANRVRTQANGGVPVALSKNMTNRPFEPQVLVPTEADGNPTTDDHEYARPVFLDATTGNATFDLPATPPAIESPGTYLGICMGSLPRTAMVRRSGGTGWDVRGLGNLTVAAAEPDRAGLIIRERPIPQTGYWPGGLGVDIVDPASPRWLPYAYGKHWYPTIAPFTPTDVSDNLFRVRPWDTASPSVTTNISLATANRVAAYSTGGRLTVTAAANPGPNDTGANGSWSGNYNGSAVSTVQRKLYFYRDPWRFIHMNKMQPDTTTTTRGLLLAYYGDPAYYDEKVSTSTISALPFSGTPIAITAPLVGGQPIVASISGRLGWATAPATSTTTLWSARWMGFVSPTVSGIYTMTVSASSAAHTVRVWVDGVRMAEYGFNSGASAPGSVTLTANRYYPIVVDFANTTTGAVGNAPTLSWSCNAGASAAVPDNRLFPPKAGFTFSRSTLTAVQCRIDNPQAIVGPAAQKVGLMIRPDHGLSPVLQGGSAYAMVGWSPTRGFFTQRRLDPATQSQRTTGLFYIGDGMSPSGAADASGQVADNPANSSTGWNRTANLYQVALSAVSAPVVAYPTNNSTAGVTWTAQPSLYSGVMTKDVGGGVIWTILDNFNVGAYVGSQTWTPQRRQSQYVTQTQTIQLRSALGSFLSADDGKNLTIFSTATGNTAYIGSQNIGYQANSRTWWFSNATGVAYPNTFNPATSLPNYLSRTWSGTTQYGTYVNGTPATVNQTTGSAASAWPVSGTVIRINKNGTTTNATPSDLATVTGLTISEIRTGTPTISTPTLTYPANGSCPAPTTAPTVTLNILLNGTAG